MKKPLASRFKKNIVGFFGVLAYLACTLQWLFTVAVYAQFIKDVLVTNTPIKEPVVQVPPATVEIAGNVPLTILAGIITVGVIALAIYVFIKMPGAIAKTGRKVVHEVAEQAAPVVLRVQHIEPAKQTPKKVRSVKSQLVVLLKVLLIIVPVILVFFSQFTDKQALDFTVAMYTSLVFAGVTTLLFAIQFALARLLHVTRQNIW